MAMMLERWNDDRMDALDAKVDGLDTKVIALEEKVDGLDSKVTDMDVRLTRVEVRVDDGFKKVDGELLEQRREMKAGFETLNERFDRMQRTMLWAAVTIIVALLASGSGIVAALIG